MHMNLTKVAGLVGASLMLAGVNNANAGTSLSAVTAGEQSPAQVSPGSNATYAVSVTRSGSGDIDIYLSATNLPNGAVGTFIPSLLHFTGPGPLTQTATLTVSTSVSLAPDVYPFVITGRDGGSWNAINVPVTLTVGAPVVIQPVPPQITSISPAGDPVITVTGKGNVGKGYLLQATFNLVAPTWSTIATNVADANGIVSYIDYDATNYPARFYRLAVRN